MSTAFALSSILSIALVCVFYFTMGACLSQEDIDYMAKSLTVRYAVINNMVFGHDFFHARITLENGAEKPIPNTDWELYFYHVTMINSTSHNATLMPSKYGVEIDHIKGCLFRMRPVVKSFPNLEKGQIHDVHFAAQYYIASRYSMFPNWYIVGKDLAPRIIKSTEGESLSFVELFDNVEKWKRYSDDMYSPFNYNDLFERNSPHSSVTPSIDSSAAIIPTPIVHKIHPTQRKLDLKNGYVFRELNESVFTNPVMFLRVKLNESVRVSHSARSPLISIQFIKGSPSLPSQAPPMSVESESYQLVIDPISFTVTITAPSDIGAFYACQSLLSLLTRPGQVSTLPAVTIIDAPRFPYRGMHLDVARNFVPLDQVLRLIDQMAAYKLNRLHLHLTDDEGWRLEIPGLSQLTNLDGKRCHDISETRCIISQWGSGPTNTTSGSGFYSKDDYATLLRYAVKHYVQVIPEIDAPGHSHAAIKAMEAYATHAHVNDPDYILTESGDPSEYLSIQMFDDNAVNPCMQSTYTFVAKIADELLKLHRDSGNPLKVFHFGGDEVAKGAWVNSTLCRRLLRNRADLNNIGDIKRYFAERVGDLTQSRNLGLAGWEDGLSIGSNPMSSVLSYNPVVYSYIWNNVWEWGQAQRAYQHANQGFKVVMSHATHLYFDHPYEPDPEERGFYWATRYTDTEKTFGFNPFNLYSLADTTREGHPIEKDSICGKGTACPNLTKPENIVGIQGQLWTETVRTRDQADEMIFPRLLAMAERSWHRAQWEDDTNEKTRETAKKADWSRFASILAKKELMRLDRIGIKYHIPRAGAKWRDGKLEANTKYRGLSIQYSFNDDGNWRTYTEPLIVTASVRLRTMSADGKRFSRTTLVKYTAPSSSHWHHKQSLVTVFACVWITSMHVL